MNVAAQLRQQALEESRRLRAEPNPPTLDWDKRAACRDTHPDIFYPRATANPGKRGHPPGHDPYARARTICAACPVQLHCLSWALTRREPDGMWGGRSPHERGQYTPNERRLIARKARQGAA